MNILISVKNDSRTINNGKEFTKDHFKMKITDLKVKLKLN